MNNMLRDKVAELLAKHAYSAKAKAVTPAGQMKRIRAGKSATSGKKPSGVAQGIKGAIGANY